MRLPIGCLVIICCLGSQGFSQTPWERSVSIAPPPPPSYASNDPGKRTEQMAKDEENAWRWAIPFLPELRDLSVSRSGELDSSLKNGSCEWLARIVIKKSFEPELVLLIKKMSNGTYVLNYAKFTNQGIHHQAMAQKIADPIIAKPDMTKMKFRSGYFDDRTAVWLKAECLKFEKLSFTSVDGSKTPLDASVYEISFFSRQHSEFAYRSHDFSPNRGISTWVESVSDKVLSKVKSDTSIH